MRNSVQFPFLLVALAATLNAPSGSRAAEPRELTFAVSEAEINRAIARSPEGQRLKGHVTLGDERAEGRGVLRLQLPYVWESFQPEVSFRFALAIPRGKIRGTHASAAVKEIEVGAPGGLGSIGLGEGEVKHLVMEALVALAMRQRDVARVASVRYVREGGLIEADLVGCPVKGYRQMNVIAAEVSARNALVQIRVW